MMATRKVMGEFRHAAQKTQKQSSVQDTTPPHGHGVKDNLFNPVQILHWIGLIRHSAINPWVWRECWALGELCKYRFDLSGKCVIQLDHP